MQKLLSKITLSIGLLLFLFLIVAFTLKNPTSQKISLMDAIKSKTITSKIMSNGKYSGNCVRITVTNNTSLPIQLLVPAGTKYSPEDEGEQTLIQMEDQLITLNAKSTYNGKVAAFCTEASDRCPTENTTMKLSRNSDPKFNKLIAYVKGKTIDRSIFQDAVWAVSDNYNVANIVATTPVAKDFRAYVADISGQKDTWFTSPQSIRIDEDGNFNRETVNISGKLEFDCAKGSQVHQDIYKENGEVFFESDRAMTSQTGHVNYTFKLSVRGWEKGNYYVYIHNGTSELAKYEFSI